MDKLTELKKKIEDIKTKSQLADIWNKANKK